MVFPGLKNRLEYAIRYCLYVIYLPTSDSFKSLFTTRAIHGGKFINRGAVKLICRRDLSCLLFKSPWIFTLTCSGLGGRSQFKEGSHPKGLLSLHDSSPKTAEQPLLHNSKMYWPRFSTVAGFNCSLGGNASADIETSAFQEIHCNCESACTVNSECVSAAPACPSHTFLGFSKEE